jgi:hypothetical protein
VELEIEPRPDRDEERALLEALAHLLAPEGTPPAYVSAWWRAGVSENTATDRTLGDGAAA